MCMFLNEYRSLFADFLQSAEICIYLPTFVLIYIYTLCNRRCPTERYIRTVRIPGEPSTESAIDHIRRKSKITVLLYSLIDNNCFYLA